MKTMYDGYRECGQQAGDTPMNAAMLFASCGFQFSELAASDELALVTVLPEDFDESKVIAIGPLVKPALALSIPYRPPAGRAVLFGDGHVEFLRQDDVSRLMRSRVGKVDDVLLP